MKPEYIIIKKRTDLDFLKNISLSGKKIFFLYPYYYEKKYASYTLNTSEKINDRKHLELLKKVIDIQSNFVKKLNKVNSLSEANKANLRHFFLNTLSSFFYIITLISKTTPCWILNNNKWKKYTNKKKVFSILSKKIFFQKKLIHFSIPKKKFNNFTSKILLKLLMIILKKKKIIILSDSNSKFVNISRKLYEKKKIVCITFVNNKKNYFINYLLNIIKLLNPFKSFILLDFNPFMEKVKDMDPILRKIIYNLNYKELNYFKNDMSLILSKPINYQNQIYNFIELFFQKLNIKMYISHHSRGVIPPVIAEIAQKNKIKSVLIPHGTLPISNNKTINTLVREISKGFVDDNFSSLVISQSKTTEIFIKNNYSNKIFKKFQPIMW